MHSGSSGTRILLTAQSVPAMPEGAGAPMRGGLQLDPHAGRSVEFVAQGGEIDVSFAPHRS